MSEESIAKTVVSCDFCKATLSGAENPSQNIKAILNEPYVHNVNSKAKEKIPTKEFAVCDESCLRGLLNARAAALRKKKKLKSKGFIEIDLKESPDYI